MAENLDPKTIENILALTPMQEGMLFHHLQDPGSGIYFEQLSIEINGEIDRKRFEKAWNIVIQANEMLRTVFRWEKLEKPSQIILKEYQCKIKLYDFSDMDNGQMKMALEKIRNNDRNEGFDLTQVPFRVILCKLNEKQNEMIISNHHILYDGWSNGIILKEFFKAYHELLCGETPVKMVKPSFKEFVRWIQDQSRDRQRKFWQEYLAGFETPTVLPIKRKIEAASNDFRYSFVLAEDSKNKLNFFAINNRVTLASVFYTAWGIMLQKYCDCCDVAFGSVVSGRSAGIKGIENMLGLFINTIPLRIQSIPDTKIIEMIAGVENILHVREEFESTSLPDIKSYSPLGGSEPLFDTIVSIENYPLDNRLIHEGCLLSIHSYTMIERTHYDLSIGISLFDEIGIKFTYNREAFDSVTIEYMAGHFKIILQNILENPEIAFSQLEIITVEEKNRILYEFNDTAAEYPLEKTLHQLFEEQAARTPHHIAVLGPTTLRYQYQYQITYHELNEQSGRLAYLLIEKGVAVDNIVAIMMKRSVEMITTIMAILKSGGAYLPLDPDYPDERIDYILKDSKAIILLTDEKKTNCQLSIVNYQLSMGGCPRRGLQHSSFVLPRAQHSNHLAYVIYTSGTTGKSKGVMLEHRNAINTVSWFIRTHSVGIDTRIIQLSDYTFDASVNQVFGALLAGAGLYITSKEVRADIEKLRDYLNVHKINIINFVPGFLKELLGGIAKLPYLHTVLSGAEKLDETFKETLTEKGYRLVNQYGPTETAIDALAMVCTSGKVSLGKPIDNVNVYILDKYEKIVPVGVTGELHIAGAGVARGYLNRPELSAERFYRSDRSNKTYIVYKSGDLCKWLPDGNIEFLGRVDHQVKIRGFRIELAEIENRLLNYPGIKESVVMARDEGHEDKYLCAYMVTGNPIDTLVLREYLLKALPGYMVPSYFITLDHMPLNRNGKVDRAALPIPGNERNLSENTYVAPGSDVEKIIADIWRQVLKIDKVGIHDNFFDLGGNSFTIIRLSNKLKDAFKKEIPVAALFNYSTIAGQSDYFSRQEPVKQETQKQLPLGTAGIVGMDIAVIGMAGRFPGARNIAEFWANIREGIESITFFSDEELKTLGVDPELIKNPNYVKAKGVLDHIEYFDPDLFDYSTREAELMDPQLRIMHECVYEALNDAGYDPYSYQDNIGLYAGSFSNSLWMRQLAAEITSHSALLAVESLNDRNYLSTRISYKLNLKGPAVTIQTACSSSLVAIDTACQSLLSGKCRIALAGGVTITFQDQTGYLHEDGMVRSPDGHCRPFDVDARGTVGGNGVAIVVLKRLADAIADRDHIRAVVKGSATNNDGSRKVGYTAPSVEGQAEVIRAAHAAAGINPETITYIETHGTGTALGDPVEIEALKQAFGTSKKHYCRLGALKAGIGHLDAAAGAAGFIKTVLALEHRELPPAVNFKAPNPQIDFANSPFYIADKLAKWENDNHPLRAGVSSFGIGGTNAHVVLEEAPKSQPPGPGRDKKLIILSAKTKNTLDRTAHNLAQYLIQNPGINLLDVAYTLQTGRRAFNHRRILVGATAPEIISALTNAAGTPGVSTATCEDSSSKHVIFMFSGQGSQYTNMGLDLYLTEPVFREEMDRALEILKSLTQYDIKAILYPALATNNEHMFNGSYRTNITVDQTEIAQPVLLAVEYALAKLLISWGVKPHAMIGHSIGEYTAACLAGVFNLADALTLVVWRGKLMQEMPVGSMLSVPLPKEEVEPLLKPFNNLSLAAVNSSSLCVISGPNEAIDTLATLLKERGQAWTRLHTSHAFHSQMMDSMLVPFGEKVKAITLKPPISPYISNTTGYWITVEQALNPQYWVNHVRETVYFNEGLTELLKDSHAVLVEVGPGNALSTFARKHKNRSAQQPVINLLRHPGDKISEDYFLLQQIGQLWLSGVTIQWEEFYRHEKRRRVPLPPYPFNHRYFWKYGQKINYKYAAAEKSETAPVTMPTMSQEKITGKPDTRKIIDEWFYIPQWQAAPKTNVPFWGGALGKWLVFSDESDFGKNLINRLKQDGAEIVLVKAGSSFARLADSLYTLNPGRPGDYVDLFKSLAIENKIPRHILHLWNTRPEDMDYTQVNRGLEKGFYSLIYLVQAAGKQGITTELYLNVISNHMQAVTAGETGNPLQSTLLGACKVIPKEYPNILVRSIDITHTKPGSREEQKLLDLLIREWDSDREKKETIEPIIAYRHNVRWVPSYRPVVLSTPQDISGQLQKKGVYLITGGMGGIGMVLAEYLARSVQARLILTGRSAFPGPDQWEQWLAEHTIQDPISLKIRRLREMEALGAEVMAVQADAGDDARMKKLFGEIIRRFGAINGIIHAAGVPDGGIIQVKTREVMETIMAPKIKGTLILDALLFGLKGDSAPDFFILCSSLSAILGAFGQVAYTAANIFLDSFALYKNSLPGISTRFISVNWDAWEEVGMAAQAETEYRSVKISHPLFMNRIVKEDGKIIYNSLFNEKKLWVLDEHRIMGKAVLPGTAYLEMAYAAFTDYTGEAQAEIKEAFFLEPFVVDNNNEQEVMTILEKKGDNFVFSISGRPAGKIGNWRQYGGGKLSSLVHHTQPELQGEENITGENENGFNEEITGNLGGSSAGFMTFGPRWQNKKNVKYGNNRGQAELELDHSFHDDLKTFSLHPALLDMAVSFLLDRVRKPGGGNYMPFTYKNIKIYKPLPGKITSTVQYVENPSPWQETLEFRVWLNDEKGERCVSIDAFIMKRVTRDAAPGRFEQTLHPAPAQREEKGENQDGNLEIAVIGNLDSIYFKPGSRVKPGPGEVEIEVYATGLNFKEVLFALGMLPLPPGTSFTFGKECSGRITQCGEGVTDVKPGDEVVAFAPSAFSRFTVTPASSVALKPAHLDFAEAAVIPVAYMTAYYSLVTLGRLTRGEKVLIHSAAGGVGLAAVKIAQWLGAEIFVTAGNPAKRAYLSSLGIAHVMDSRSGDFAAQIMEITGGKGVDVLLNSLPGEMITRGISTLAPYGRFLELGVRDIAENTQLGMRFFEKSISFSAVSISREIHGFTTLFREVVNHLHEKHFECIPFRAYPISQAAEAFKYMAQAKHTGKIVIVRPEYRGTAGKGIAPGEGIDIFTRLLNRENASTNTVLSQVIVSTVDFNARLRDNQEKNIPGEKEQESSAVSFPVHTGSRNPRPSLSTDYVSPSSEMEKRLAAVWEEYLGLEKVGIHDNFFELGASSLDIIQVNHKLNALLGKEVSVVTFYTYPTVHTLAAHWDGEKTGEDMSSHLSKSQKTLKGTINKMKGMKR